MAATAQNSSLGFFGYDEESAFAEVSTTYDKVLQVRNTTLNPTALNRPLIERGGTFQYMGDSEFGVPGPFTGMTFRVEMDFYGHGSATNTSLSETPLGRLLGHVFGVSDATQVGGSITSNPADGTSLISTETTLLAGGIVRVGVKGDGRADGQAAIVADNSSEYELCTGLPGTPTTDDDIFVSQMIYPDVTNSNNHLTSDGSAQNNTIRAIIATANKQWACRGCACTGVEVTSIDAAGIPRIALTFMAAHVTPIDVTFPSTTASSDSAPAVVSGGSFFYQTVGTVTRQTEPVRNVSLTIDHGVVPIIGSGGANEGQVIQGYVRTMSIPRLSFSVEAEDATTSPAWSSWWDTDPNTNTYRHILYTMSVTDGRAIALYMPKCRPIGPRPTQADIEGLNYVPVQVEGRVADPGNDWSTPSVSADALTRSPWRLGLG